MRGSRHDAGAGAARFAVVLAASLLVLAALPAVAMARPTVQIVGSGSTKTVNYEAGTLDGQNDPQFTVSGTNFRIAEFGGGSAQRIDVGPGCTKQSDEVALCPTSGVVRINVTTKGGDDDPLMSSIAVSAVVDLGEGTDSVAKGAGNDTLIGGDGDDGLVAGLGNDTLHGDQLDGGGNGDDTLFGGGGNDVLKGGKQNDDLDGGDQDDTLDGGFDSDEMVGGPGIDTVDYSSRTKAVIVRIGGFFTSGNADDGLDSFSRDDIKSDVENLIGGSGPDQLSGSNVANRLNGQGGGDELFAAGGDDTLIGSAGPDVLVGGEGSGDVAFYADHAAAVNVTIGGDDNDGNSVDGPAGSRDNVLSDVEGVLGSPGDDTLTGDANPNTLDGGAGADTFNGLGGVDTVSYASHSAGVTVTLGDGVANEGNSTDVSTTGSGARDRIQPDIETVAGGPGSDTMTGDANANTFQGNGGADTLDGAGGNDFLDGGIHPDTLIGGPGAADEVTYASRASGVVVTLDDVRNDGNPLDRPFPAFPGPVDDVQSTVENVVGTPAIDRLEGSAVGNKLTGQGGGDTLLGFAGGDNLLGGDDNDTLEGSGGKDTLDGQLGADVLDGGNGSDLMDGGVEQVTLVRDVVDYSDRTTPIDVTLGNTGPGGLQLLDDGGAEDGPLTQRDGIIRVEDVIGGSGDDRIVDAGPAGAGSVTNRFIGGPGSDQLDGGPGGNDFLEGDAGDDQLAGGEGGNDLLEGGDGADQLSGDAGFGDVLDGGTGPDLISGGADGGDVADYSPRGDAVTVTLLDNAPNDGNADDGPVGARDTVADDVEDAIGGSGDDTLEGNPGVNELDGGEGSDTLQGFEGADFLTAGGGDDTLNGGIDADRIVGDEGSDTVSYDDRTDPVSVNLSLNGGFNQGGPSDGAEGFRDTITEVENATGGSGADTLIGSAAANFLRGGPGGDTVDSGGPEDLSGDGIPDDVDGDQVRGGADDDTINSVDSLFPPEATPRGAIDDVSCGAGTDKATVDLKDTPPGIIVDCEDFLRAAVDQHPTVRIVPRPKLLTEQHELVVRLGCPSELGLACKGKLSARTLTVVSSEQPPEELATTAEPGPLLDSHGYRIRSGHREAVHLSLSQADVNRILEANWIRLRARELDPQGRLKLTSRDCATGHQAEDCRIRVS